MRNVKVLEDAALELDEVGLKIRAALDQAGDGELADGAAVNPQVPEPREWWVICVEGRRPKSRLVVWLGRVVVEVEVWTLERLGDPYVESEWPEEVVLQALAIRTPDVEGSYRELQSGYVREEGEDREDIKGVVLSRDNSLGAYAEA